MTLKRWLLVGSSCALVALLAAPRVAHAVKVWEEARRQAAFAAARAAIAAGADGLPDITALLEPNDEPEDPDSRDSATVRALAMAAEIGPRPAQAMQQLLAEAAKERARWAALPAAPAGTTTPGTRTWSNLGPLAARSQFNGTYYKAMDSGRPTSIVMDPTSPNGVFLATSGGGVWYAPDINGNYPSWSPITESLGSLAVGAMDVVASGPGVVTVWLGLGDAFDQKAGLVVKGSLTPASGVVFWGGPSALTTASHPADGFPASAQDVRDLKVDPNDSNHILVATNEGLFQSTDGTTFNIVDLPNAAGFGPARESTWSIAYLGKDGGSGKSVWLVSGVYGCPTLAGQTTGTSPPLAGFGLNACGADTTRWNQGDIWKSVDGGATWTSLRATFPAAVLAAGPGNDPGRIALGTGATTDPASTVVYAQAGTSYEGATNLPAGCNPVAVGATACALINATAWYLKSTDGGDTWSAIATGLSFGRGGVANPTLVKNPTTLVGDATLTSGSGCRTVNVGHVQSWYNLAVAVDPQNPNRAIFGGDLCSIITTDGGATYASASHWLPQGGSGFTAQGFLPYVHADWHTALAVVQPGGQTMLLVGTDGGLFVTRNIWDVPAPEVGSWLQPDVGLATHLFYGIGTGDPTLGNPNVVFGGLQDNGTRWRLVSDEAFIAEFNPGNWDQVLGGDGLGAAATSDTRGQNVVYWISVNGTRRFCRPRSWDCSQATRIENGVESANWRNPGAAAADPFLIRFDPLGDDTSGVASASNTSAFLWFIDPVSNLASVRTVVTAGSVVVDGTARTIRGMGLRVSPYRYTIDGVANSRIYGGVTTSGSTAMGSFLVYDKPGVAATTVVPAAHGVSIPGVTGKGTGTIWIGNGSDFAAPQNPASLGGTDPKKTWLVSSNSLLSNPVNCANPASPTCDPAVFIPASVGHLFKTIDGGNTWIPLHGNGTGFDLPNAPIYVLRYDPADTTDKTLWVGTEFGLYRTTDGGNTWAPYGLGLPAVRVTDVRISNNGGTVRVSTYGRGVWEITPGSEPPAGPGTGDFDRSQIIDFFDVASLAARMGSTPAATNNLAYDSSTDLNGSATLDETDLGLLLAKFGSTP